MHVRALLVVTLLVGCSSSANDAAVEPNSTFHEGGAEAQSTPDAPGATDSGSSTAIDASTPNAADSDSVTDATTDARSDTSAPHTDASVGSTSGPPSISAVSGGLVHGQIVTVTGNGFGTKPVAAPLKWDDFESWAVGSDLVTGCGYANEDGDGSKAYVRNDRAYGRGSKSAKMDYATGRDSMFPRIGTNLPSGVTEIYVSHRAYWTVTRAPEVPPSSSSGHVEARIHPTPASHDFTRRSAQATTAL